MTDHDVKRVNRGVVSDAVLDAYLPRGFVQTLRFRHSPAFWREARQNAELLEPFTERDFSTAMPFAMHGAMRDHNARLNKKIEAKWNQAASGKLEIFLYRMMEAELWAEILSRGAPDAAKHLKSAQRSLRRATSKIAHGLLAVKDSGAPPKRGPLGTAFERGLIWRLFAVWAVMLGERPSRKKVEKDKEPPVFYHFAHRVLSVCQAKGESTIDPKQPRSLISTARNLPRDRWKIISPLLEASKERKFVEVEGAEPWMLDMVIARVS